MSKVKILLFILNLFLFVFALPVETSAGTGSLSVQILEQKNGLAIASYADSGSVQGPTPSGGFVGISDCEAVGYNGTCVNFIRNTQNQITKINILNVLPGNYKIEITRTGYQTGHTSYSICANSDPKCTSAMFENTQNDGEVILVSNTEEAIPIPKITDPGTITRATSSTFEVTNFSSASLLTARYALELVNQSGARFDCQEVRPDSGSSTTAHVNLRAPADNSISQVSLRLFRTNSRDTGVSACDDIAGQSPIDSVSPFLSKPAGGAAAQVMYKYDKITNSCNPDTSGEPPEECEKKIIKMTPVPSHCTKDDITAGKCTKGGGEPCDNNDPLDPGLKTAIGCIHTNPAVFAKDFMTFAIGIGGGLSFLMMLLGAFQMLTSSGNPDTLKAGQERFTSAIIGLLFVIFAVLLLQIIGADILKIPDFKP